MLYSIVRNIQKFEISENYDPKCLKLTKHYPRLRNEQWTAAVEVHHQILIYPHYKILDAGILIIGSKKLDLPVYASVLSDNYQIIHNILNFQINDYGYYYGDISLRQSYDLLHLSQRLNPLVTIIYFGKFFNQMNGSLALANRLFENPPCLTYRKNLQSGIFLSRIKRHLNNPRWATFSNKYLKSILIFKTSLFRDAGILIQAIYNRESRSHISSRIGNPRWYLVHFRSYQKT